MAMTPLSSDLEFAFCIESRDCDDLEQGKVYRIFPDAVAVQEGYLRVMDESIEDYLYPESYFVRIDLPTTGFKRTL